MGIEVGSGIEVFVHGFKAALKWASNNKDGVALKIDFQNAFNMIRRRKLFHIIQNRLPSLLGYVDGCYSKHSLLILPTGDTIKSQSGVQQGDPLGCALFALVLADALELTLNKHQFPSLYWSAYHDDLTLAGKM